MPTAGVHPVPPSPAPPELEPDPELEPELEPEPDPDPELDPELDPLDPLDGLTPLDEPPCDPDDPLEVVPELPEEDDAAPEEPLLAEPSESPPPDDPGTFPNPGPEGADVPHEAAKHPTNAHSAHRRRIMASTFFHRAASVPDRSAGQCQRS
jgi:hypothetical protein